MAELSYALLKDKGREFFTGRIPLLIIDPTGSGDFTSDNIRFVRSSSTDHTREKIIFRNVFLDTDGSGSDIFSFGYYDGLKASILPHDTHCKNGTSLPDGSINIAIELGTPSYTYRLKAAEVPGIPPKSIVREGTFGEDVFTIGHLFTGLYELTLAQEEAIVSLLPVPCCFTAILKTRGVSAQEVYHGYTQTCPLMYASEYCKPAVLLNP